MKKQDLIVQKEMIQRLVRYKNILLKFKSMGLSRVFSDNLGDAAGILDQLAAAGIQGVLNFSPVQLKAGSALVVQNINLAFEIENLFYYVRFNQRKDLPSAP